MLCVWDFEAHLQYSIEGYNTCVYPIKAQRTQLYSAERVAVQGTSSNSSHSYSSNYNTHTHTHNKTFATSASRASVVFCATDKSFHQFFDSLSRKAISIHKTKSFKHKTKKKRKQRACGLGFAPRQIESSRIQRRAAQCSKSKSQTLLPRPPGLDCQPLAIVLICSLLCVSMILVCICVYINMGRNWFSHDKNPATPECDEMRCYAMRRTSANAHTREMRRSDRFSRLGLLWPAKQVVLIFSMCVCFGFCVMCTFCRA